MKESIRDQNSIILNNQNDQLYYWISIRREGQTQRSKERERDEERSQKAPQIINIQLMLGKLQKLERRMASCWNHHWSYLWKLNFIREKTLTLIPNVLAQYSASNILHLLSVYIWAKRPKLHRPDTFPFTC